MASPDLEKRDAGGRSPTATGWVRWWASWERAAQPVSDRLVDLAGVAPGHTVLDVATGLGEPAFTAARRVGPRGRVVATDTAPDMLGEAAARADALGLANIEFREMDAGAPDPDGGPFDAILCRWGLMFVPDLDGCLRQLLALLKPGGGFAAAVWGAPDDVPLLRLSGSVIADVALLPEAAPSFLPPFRLSDPAILTGALARAGFARIVREDVRVTFRFESAEEYTRFRRDMTTLDAMLAEHHPPDTVEAAWQAVTEAARAYADAGGRVRFVNTAVCYSGTR